MNYCVIPNKHNIWGLCLRNRRFISLANKRASEEEGFLWRLLSLTQRHLAKLRLRSCAPTIWSNYRWRSCLLTRSWVIEEKGSWGRNLPIMNGKCWMIKSLFNNASLLVSFKPDMITRVFPGWSRCFWGTISAATALSLSFKLRGSSVILLFLPSEWSHRRCCLPFRNIHRHDQIYYRLHWLVEVYEP